MIYINFLSLICLSLLLIFFENIGTYFKQIFTIINSIFKKNIDKANFYIKNLILVSLNLFLLVKAFSHLNLSLNYSIYLYIFISGIIISRLYIDQRTLEKEYLINELKTLINEISESIEESFSLDSAIRNTFNTIKLKSLQDDISNFCKLHNYNIQNEIVNFFKTLAKKHSIKEFKNYIQLLSLELKFNQSPVNIFKEINIFLNNQEKNRKKFKNSYKLINLSIDFMLIFYYLNLLILIPKLNSSNPEWFEDTNKDLAIFFSSILFWLVYISSHIFLNKKKGELL
mgnify:CR=1 FL=1